MGTGRTVASLATKGGIFVVGYRKYGRIHFPRGRTTQLRGRLTTRKGIAKVVAASCVYGPRGVRLHLGGRVDGVRRTSLILMFSYNINMRAISRCLRSGVIYTTYSACPMPNFRNIAPLRCGYSRYNRYCLGLANKVYPVATYSGDLIGNRYNNSGGNGYRISGRVRYK